MQHRTGGILCDLVVRCTSLRWTDCPWHPNPYCFVDLCQWQPNPYCFVDLCQYLSIHPRYDLVVPLRVHGGDASVRKYLITPLLKEQPATALRRASFKGRPSGSSQAQCILTFARDGRPISRTQLLPFFQNGAKSGFEMCFEGAGGNIRCWGQNTSRIRNKEMGILFMNLFAGQNVL